MLPASLSGHLVVPSQAAPRHPTCPQRAPPPVSPPSPQEAPTPPLPAPAHLRVQSGQQRVELDLQCAAAHAHGCIKDLAQALLAAARRKGWSVPSRTPAPSQLNVSATRTQPWSPHWGSNEEAPPLPLGFRAGHEEGEPQATWCRYPALPGTGSGSHPARNLNRPLRATATGR